MSPKYFTSYGLVTSMAPDAMNLTVLSTIVSHTPAFDNTHQMFFGPAPADEDSFSCPWGLTKTIHIHRPRPGTNPAEPAEMVNYRLRTPRRMRSVFGRLRLMFVAISADRAWSFTRRRSGARPLIRGRWSPQMVVVFGLEVPSPR